jgi:hypothetical protein
LIFEVCVTETFEGAGVCDVSTRGICCCPVSVDEDCGDFEMREEDSCGASTGPYRSELGDLRDTGSYDEDVSFGEYFEVFPRDSHIDDNIRCRGIVYKYLK